MSSSAPAWSASCAPEACGSAAWRVLPNPTMPTPTIRCQQPCGKAAAQLKMTGDVKGSSHAARLLVRMWCGWWSNKVRRDPFLWACGESVIVVMLPCLVCVCYMSNRTPFCRRQGCVVCRWPHDVVWPLPVVGRLSGMDATLSESCLLQQTSRGPVVFANGRHRTHCACFLVM